MLLGKLRAGCDDTAGVGVRAVSLGVCCFGTDGNTYKYAYACSYANANPYTDPNTYVNAFANEHTA